MDQTPDIGDYVYGQSMTIESMMNMPASSIVSRRDVGGCAGIARALHITAATAKASCRFMVATGALLYLLW